MTSLVAAAPVFLLLGAERRSVWRVTDSELPLALDARNMILFYVPEILE